MRAPSAEPQRLVEPPPLVYDDEQEHRSGDTNHDTLAYPVGPLRGNDGGEDTAHNCGAGEPAVPEDRRARRLQRERLSREAAQHRVVAEHRNAVELAVEEEAHVDDAVGE